jgi:flagellar hook-associated protein 1 FlgK
MPNLFAGVNLALQAMLSQQHAVEVIEHNVANASTPGYRRQRAVLSANPTLANGFLQGDGVGLIGTGVSVDRIQRYSVDVFDRRFRLEVAESKRWQVEHEALQQLEGTLAETSGSGLLPKLDAFWTGWQALGADPTNLSLRADLRDRASGLANAIRTRAVQIDTQRRDLNLEVVERVDEVNLAARQVASLNREISKAISTGDQPNDLFDHRDRLLDRLSELTGSVSFRQSNGEVVVSIAGHTLVQGHETFQLAAVTDAATGLVNVEWSNHTPFAAESGELKGLIEARDGAIKDQRDALDTLASNLVANVNGLHATGVDMNNAAGGHFFDPAGTTAATISLSANLDDLAHIAAASAANQPGNGVRALEIAALRTRPLSAAIAANPNEYYQSQITSLALAVNRSGANASDRQIVADTLNGQRESVSGVNLNEEAANLVKAQRSYEAAARLMTVMDEMLDRVINGLGTGGR